MWVLFDAYTLSAYHLPITNAGFNIKSVPVSGMTFQHAALCTTIQTPNDIWDYQLGTQIAVEIHKGDVILASFWAKSAGKTKAQSDFVLEQSSTPFTKSIDYAFVISPKWKHYDLPFTALQDFAPGQSQTSFRLGYSPQSFLIGGIQLLDFGQQTALSTLPSTESYGLRKNTAWLNAAEKRIERIREANLSVRVVNSQNRPVKNATVHIEMLKHSFPFGSAVDADGLLGTTPDDLKYKKMVLELFNRVVMENDLKWPEWDQDPTLAEDGVNCLLAHNIQVRGHNLVWPSWKWLPEKIHALSSDPAALKAAIDHHITSEMTALKGKCVEWDVVNEPVVNHNIQDILGPNILAHFYRVAHRADPAAKLFINDYNIVAAGGNDIGHQNAYYDIIKNLLAQGAPLGGIGVQCHFGTDLTPPQRAFQIINRFGSFGLPVEVTEMDINVPTPQLQAEYMKQFMITAYSNPHISGIVMWGFWAGRHWRPEAALWDKDWKIKPAGTAWMNLVFHKWWTDESLNTDTSGSVHTRGFMGDYKITVNRNGISHTQLFALRKQGASITVKI